MVVVDQLRSELLVVGRKSVAREFFIDFKFLHLFLHLQNLLFQFYVHFILFSVLINIVLQLSLYAIVQVFISVAVILIRNSLQFDICSAQLNLQIFDLARFRLQIPLLVLNFHSQLINSVIFVFYFGLVDGFHLM